MRYLVKRGTKEVFVWTELLAKRKDMDEVHADSPERAAKADPLPDLNNLSLEQIERMKKDDLVMFAKIRLGLELDPSLTKDELADTVKQEVLLGGRSPGVGPAITETAPIPSVAEARRRPFDKVRA